MRVELQQNENEESSANSMRLLVNQLREITGIQDLELLQRALVAANGDIIHAISLVTAPTPEEAQAPEEPSGGEENQEAERDVQRVEVKDDLQAAIELSLQGNQNGDNREHNRPVEKIVIHVKRKRCEPMGESCSPAELSRHDNWPVGIRNVGNTCWFSAVIQSLFHLPVFRRLVLNYCLSERVLEKCRSHSEKRNIAFMQELRCLFALMLGSTRRFVDPSAAVELLRDSFRTSEAQQDVSEFTHKLLDWLEDAFQLSAVGNNPDDKKDNPMVQLFYGTFVAKRTHEGKTQSNIEQFGQYPLQVNGFNNLDECLEGAMVETEVEGAHSEQTVSSGQERWFSKLPPVLTFELSRFEFNQSLGRPEKIHKKLEFPQVIYMDRYLHRNVELTQSRRGAVKRLKEQLTALQQRLESYKNYGSGPVKYPLADMLQYILEFATTRPCSAPPSSTSPQPPPHTEPSADNTASDPSEGAPPSSDAPSPSPAQRTPIHKPFTHWCPPQDGQVQPAPHSITEEELQVVRGCLQRWRAEVDNDVNELKASIERVSHELEQIYSDNSLCQVPYRLHAVLVHEGQASAGHYWAYIYDHLHQRWLKYNDVMVTESSWEELVRDSYGGMTNASAYCLMYINDKLPHLIEEDTDGDTGQVLEGVDALPSILRRYVLEDNRWFQQQLREWEEQLAQQNQQQNASLTPLQQEQQPEREPDQEPPHQEPAEPEQEPEQEQEPEEEREQEPEQEPEETEEPEQEHADEPNQEPHHEETSIEEPRVDPPVPEAAVPREMSPERGESPEAAPLEYHQAGGSPQDTQVSGESALMDEGREAAEDQRGSEHTQQEEAVSTDNQPDNTTTQSSSEEGRAGARAPVETQPQENVMSEVDIPNVGKIQVLSNSDGFNEEMILTPAMQGIILAIAKASKVIDKDGPEAGLIKAFHEEYSRLFELSQESGTPQQDARLQHVLVYLFQNRAPKRIIERTLLEQFGDRNLSFDDRSMSIMREARSKIRLIKPEDMDMEEYLKWHDDYSMFKTVFAYLLTGLEQYQNGKLREALIYLAHAYQDNATLMRGGDRKGVEQTLIGRYRRKCLMELNDRAAKLFKSEEVEEAEDAVAMVNDCVIPCVHLMARDSVCQEDLDAIEHIRGVWCGYLGQDMKDSLQEKLSEFLPRVLDCSTERVVLKEPPQVCSNSPHDLESRLAAVMESMVTVT
ncbi:ubiquitin carboxyl-terminal hydrolase 28 [Alosa sapidissima]|nr:ubiquitin carboxyl-terminal hydrolase 28 [Alosa sapidissima]